MLQSTDENGVTLTVLSGLSILSTLIAWAKQQNMKVFVE